MRIKNLFVKHMLSYSLPEEFYNKDGIVVWSRPKLTLGASHVTQPFYSTSDVIDALTN